MAELLLGNIDETLSDEEIGEFLIRYGFPRFDAIQRLPGAGSRPGALLTFNDVNPSSLRTLQSRIHNMYWKKHLISAQILPERDET